MQQLVLLFFIFIITAYWIDSVQVKEIAKRAGAYACKKHDVQFLDNTVIKQKTAIKRHPTNLIQLQRTYTFEYSIDGTKRDSGIIITSGHHIHEIQIDLHTFDNRDDA